MLLFHVSSDGVGPVVILYLVLVVLGSSPGVLFVLLDVRLSL